MNEQIVILLLGAVLPPVIDMINKFVKNKSWRFVIALVVSLVVGAILAIAQYGTGEVLANGTLIFAASQTVYNLIYAKSELQAKVRG